MESIRPRLRLVEHQSNALSLRVWATDSAPMVHVGVHEHMRFHWRFVERRSLEAPRDRIEPLTEFAEVSKRNDRRLNLMDESCGHRAGGERYSLSIHRLRVEPELNADALLALKDQFRSRFWFG